MFSRTSRAQQILKKLGKRKRFLLQKDISLNSMLELKNLHTEYALFGFRDNAANIERTIKHYETTLSE